MHNNNDLLAQVYLNFLQSIYQSLKKLEQEIKDLPPEVRFKIEMASKCNNRASDVISEYIISLKNVDNTIEKVEKIIDDLSPEMKVKAKETLKEYLDMIQ